MLGFQPFNLGPADPWYALPLQTVLIQIKEANWSGSALFVIKYMNLYQQRG